MADKPFPIEPEYNRFIPPVVDETLDKAEEDEWSDEPPSDTQLIENDDGSVTVLEPEEPVRDSSFGENLAEVLPEHELVALATKYVDLIDKDKQARELRDKQYEEGIKRTGLGGDAPGGAQFAGASKVVHPVLAEGCVDFASRAIKELCPPNGPVRTQILGKQTGKKLQQANRKRNFLNWQLTKHCPSFFTELEQTLSQLPLGGSQYIKVLPKGSNALDFEFVPIDKLLIPFAAPNFYVAQRVTHIQEITQQTFEERVEEGYYRDIDTFAANEVPEQTSSEKATDKIEGKDVTAYNEDGLRTIYEVTCYDKISDDEQLSPYVIAIDQTTSKVLAIYRNWEESDEKRTKLDWIVEFKFIPWRGAYGIGLPHLIGGLAAALTGALRALLDSALVNTAPTALKLKGARFSGQTQQVEITQIQEIEGVPGTSDIRQIIMPMPFNPPSPVLFQLLDWLTAASKGVVATAEEKIADAGNNMPVGTALALIEQGSYNYSAIHSRLHNSMAKLLQIVCRINYNNLEEEVVIEELGEDIIYREDFKAANDIVPVSDPNIFSESQRYAQIQAVMQLAVQGKEMGVDYDLWEVHRRALELMKVPDADDILPQKPKPREMNAIAENVSMMLGSPLMVYPEQDHLAHIETHLRFATDPNFGANPLAAGKVLPAALEHITNHLAFYYADMCNKIAEGAMPSGPDSIDEKKLDQFMAAVSAKAVGEAQALFQPLQQVISQARQLLAQNMPPMPEDPAVKVQREIGMAEIQRQTQKDQGELQLKAQDQQGKMQESQAKLAMEQQKMMDENAEKINNLQAEAERLKLEATDMLNRAANEQQKLDLERRQQELDYSLRVAELERKELELQQKMMDQVQARMNEVEDDEPEENEALNAVLEAVQSLAKEVATIKQAPQQQDMSQVLMATLKELIEAQNAPKMLIKDAQGRPVGMAPIPKGERLQ